MKNNICVAKIDEIIKQTSAGDKFPVSSVLDADSGSRTAAKNTNAKNKNGDEYENF